MKIVSMHIRPVKRDKIRISWEFAKTLEDFQDFIFVLERSEADNEGFTPVTKFNHTKEYVDTINYRRLWKSLYYRIRITNIPSGEVTYSDSYCMQVPPNLEALEIVRRNDILLKNKRHGIGVPVAIFKEKKIGPSCICWDRNKQRVRRSSCDECFGSHIQGGYYKPIIVWANLSPDTKMVQIPQWGEMEPNEKRIFMSNYPVLSPRDLIYNPSNATMYMIDKIETSERRGTMLHQIISASFLDRNSVVYKLLDREQDLDKNLREETMKIKRS